MFMKKYFTLIPFLIIVALAACKKDKFDPEIQAATDEGIIQTYISRNEIPAVRDSASGLYYQIINPGSGTAAPTDSSIIKVNYTGKLITGELFDQQTNLSSRLGALIPAWRIGLPHIKAGGSIKLIVPSKLAYGNQVVGSIPRNSILVFDIALLQVTN